MKNLFRLLSLISIALLVASCESDPVSTTPPVVQQQSKGSLVGKVELRESEGQLATDQSEAIVTIEGTAFADTTDASGRWRIDSVPAGVYDVTVSKADFTTQRVFNFQFVGVGTALVAPSTQSSVQLLRLPPHRIRTLVAEAFAGGSPHITISGTTTATVANQFVLIFVGTTPEVSSKHGTYLYTWFAQTRDDGTFEPPQMDLEDIAPFGVTSGQTLYMVAYPSLSYGMRQYDLLKDRWYFSDLVDVPSPVAGVVVP